MRAALSIHGRAGAQGNYREESRGLRTDTLDVLADADPRA
jgi:hypothetical protein